MKIIKTLLIFIGLSLLFSCSNSKVEDKERSPRENLEFLYSSEEQVEAPQRAKVNYYGEHFFKE